MQPSTGDSHAKPSQAAMSSLELNVPDCLCATPGVCPLLCRFLWGYDPSMDDELQEVFNMVVAAGVNVSREEGRGLWGPGRGGEQGRAG